VTEREGGQQFEQDEIDCIRSVADSAAIAIRNLHQRKRLRDSIRVLLLTVGRLAEYRDEETADHLERVADYTRILAQELANSSGFARTITAEFIEDIYQAAPLHDIGKVGIPDDILAKPGRLSDEEFRIMKKHTEIGRQTLEFALAKTGPVPMLNLCIDIAYCHHEKYDGSGYPRGITGDEIPLAARIVALVDAYDAITSRRRYSEPRSHEEAIDVIRAESGKHFDPHVVEAFLRCTDHFEAVRRTQKELVEEPALVPA
jgi:putative two-component system response regulator